VGKDTAFVVVTDESSQVYRDTVSFLDDHENGKAVLESVLATDEENETWEFSDLDLSSGTFGEIVSTGIVEKVDGEYRITDPDAVHSALHGESPESATSKMESTVSIRTVRGRLESLFSIQSGLVVLGLLCIAFMRSVFHYRSMFRDGTVVLPGNDPYRRRYWLEQLVASDLQPWNVFDLSSVPDIVATSNTLFYWITWTAAALLGNSVDSVSLVLTWFPVVTAILTGFVVYRLAVRLTRDVRIGIASVFMLAVIPIHATYTALGMGDHHSLDYLLLTLIIGTIVLIVDNKPTVSIGGRHVSARWSGAVGLGVSLACMNAAWEGAPLWFFGVGVYVVGQTTLDYYRGCSSVKTVGPILAGAAISSVITLLWWLGFDWFQPYRIVTPLLLVAGISVVLVANFAGVHFGIPSKFGIPITYAGGGVTTIIAWFFVPPFAKNINRFREFLQTTSAENITETASLFSPQLGIFGGPMSYVGGGTFALGVLTLSWLTWNAIREYRPEWLAVTVFGWYLLGWATIQVRFTAEFAPLIALFAGVGFVSLLAWVDLAAKPTGIRQQDRADESTTVHSSLEKLSIDISNWHRKMVYVTALFLLVSIFSFIFIPSFMADITVSDDTYESAEWLSTYSDQQGYEYPENYVFSPWSQNRQYNYYVNGQSDSYAYALQHYEEFIRSTDPDQWYTELGSRAGFIITHSLDTSVPSESTQARLHKRLGSRGDGVSGVAHYRPLYVSENRNRVLFQLVPGARLTGIAEPNKTFEIETEVEIEGRTFTYQRTVQTNQYGDYGVTVPNPGTYELDNRSYQVSPPQVENGTYLNNYRAHFHFDERTGTQTYDAVSGTKASLDGSEKTEGVFGNAVEFEGENKESIAIGSNQVDLTGSGEFTACSWVKPDDSSEKQDIIHLGNYEVLLSWSGDSSTWEAYFRSNNRSYSVTTQTPDAEGEWTFVCGRYDGTELSLWINGQPMSSITASGTVGNHPGVDSIGSSAGKNRYFDGSIDNIIIYSNALSPDQIQTLIDRPILLVE
jgi:dolichyl-diphosphooligosaccharide--protein glycosyltransferase